MKQVFAMRRKAATWTAALIVAALAGPGSGTAAPVRGSVKLAPDEVRNERVGFTRTRVAGPSDRLEARKVDVALFLKVEESLPIPQPEAPAQVVIRGLDLVPKVATCAVDSTVVFVNEEPSPVTLTIDDVELRIGAGETRAYECAVGEPQRTLRIKEWPHVRGLVYVGEVGVAAALDERGNFVMAAPNGKYELQVLNRDGVVATRPVEVTGGSVNVGVIDLNTPATDGEAGEP